MSNHDNSKPTGRKPGPYEKKVNEAIDKCTKEFNNLKIEIERLLGSTTDGVKNAEEINALHTDIINKAGEIADEYKTLFEDKDDNNFSIIGDIKDSSERIREHYLATNEAAKKITTLKEEIEESSNAIIAWVEKAGQEKNDLNSAYHDILGLAENSKKSKLADMLDSYEIITKQNGMAKSISFKKLCLAMKRKIGIKKSAKKRLDNYRKMKLIKMKMGSFIS